MKIADFDGGYNRVGRINVVISECYVCRRSGIPVILIDGSEREYSSGRICQECVGKSINDFLNRSVAKKCD